MVAIGYKLYYIFVLSVLYLYSIQIELEYIKVKVIGVKWRHLISYLLIAYLRYVLSLIIL